MVKFFKNNSTGKNTSNFVSGIFMFNYMAKKEG